MHGCCRREPKGRVHSRGARAMGLRRLEDRIGVGSFAVRVQHTPRTGVELAFAQ